MKTLQIANGKPEGIGSVQGVDKATTYFETFKLVVDSIFVRIGTFADCDYLITPVAALVGWDPAVSSSLLVRPAPDKMSEQFDEATQVRLSLGPIFVLPPFFFQKELAGFLEREQAQARFQSSIHSFTSMCWDKYAWVQSLSTSPDRRS